MSSKPVTNTFLFFLENRRLGKKMPKKDGEDNKLTNATARVQHMIRSKVLAVTSHEDMDG